MLVKPNIVIQIAMAVFCFAMAYAFWLAHRDPANNRVTRFLYSYVDATRFPLLSVNTTMLAIAIISLVIGIGTLIMMVAVPVK